MAQSSEIKLNKRFDQNIEITGTLTVGGSEIDFSSFLTSFTETDPTVPSHVKSITATNISNWNTAYGWGNHADAGYLTSLPSHTHDYVPERGRSDWDDGTVIGDVIGQLAWKNYGNLHTIFDASAGTSPDGTSVNSSNSTYAWQATYPTLMGWNGSNTYGVRVDSARVSDTSNYATNAGTLDSLDSTEFARGRAAWQQLNFDAIKQPGLYQYDSIAAGGGTAPPDASPYNFRTIEIGSANRYSQIALGYNTDSMYFRRNMDGNWSTWRTVIHDGNIGSQSVSYATNAGTLDGIDSSNFFRTDGTYPNTDMNDTVEGYWHVASGSANLPVNYYGHRWDYDHVQNGQWVFQMYSPTSGDVDLWFRQKRNYSTTAWQKVLTSANIGSYAAPTSGSWNGANMPGSRWNGYSVNGGEVVFQRDNPNNGQMSIMVDGNFYAGENNGFWSLHANNSYNSKAGMYADGNGYLILDSPSGGRVKVKAGSSSQMNINHDQIWTDSGNLHFQYSGSGNIDMNLGGGHTFSRTSLRAPVFYDWNDTNYYVDSNSTSVLNVANFNKIGGFLDVAYTDFYVYGDENTYYPVIISGSAAYGFHEYSITRGYGWTAPWNPIGTGAHKGGLTFNFYWSGDIAWGGNDHNIRVKQFSEQYTSMVAGLALPVTGGVCVWLRGGGSGGAMYRLRAPRGHNHGYTVYDGVSASGHSTSTTFTAGNGATFSPRTDTSNNSGEIYGRYPVRGTNEIAASSITASSVDAGTVYGDDVYTTGGWFRNHTNSNGIYWSTTGWHLNPQNSNDFTFRSGSSVESTIRLANSGNTTWGYIHNDSSKTIGFLNYNRSWVSYTDVNGNHYSVASSRAPIFYDSNNTGYYVNPDSTSVLYDLSIGNGSSGNQKIEIRYGNSTSGYGAVRFFQSGSNNQTIHAFSTSWQGGLFPSQSAGAINITGANGVTFGGWNNPDAWIDNSGNISARVNMFAGTFYDRDNTGYYCNPAGNSNFNEAGFDGTVNFTKSTYPVFVYSYGNTGSVSAQGLQVYSSGNNGAIMSFHKGGYYAVNMGLDSDSVFRIGGWSASANRLQMDMSGNLTMAGDILAYSDARVKENIKTIDNALDKVKKARGVYYNRTDSEDKSTKIGVIAQEMLEVVPEVVNQDNDGMYNVSYGNITALLIEAVKELSNKVEDLENQLKQKS